MASTNKKSSVSMKPSSFAPLKYLTSMNDKNSRPNWNKTKTWKIPLNRLFITKGQIHLCWSHFKILILIILIRWSRSFIRFRHNRRRLRRKGMRMVRMGSNNRCRKMWMRAYKNKFLLFNKLTTIIKRHKSTKPLPTPSTPISKASTLLVTLTQWKTNWRKTKSYFQKVLYSKIY